MKVIFCYSHIDEFVMQNLAEHNKRKLVNIETDGGEPHSCRYRVGIILISLVVSGNPGQRD